MHDQKFGTFYSLRPEDGLYGSNEPKKCEIRPVVSSIVHFKVFKSYFIYIIDNESDEHSFVELRMNFFFETWYISQENGLKFKLKKCLQLSQFVRVNSEH